jgi:hypothetical protein
MTEFRTVEAGDVRSRRAPEGPEPAGPAAVRLRKAEVPESLP